MGQPFAVGLVGTAFAPSSFAPFVVVVVGGGGIVVDAQYSSALPFPAAVGGPVASGRSSLDPSLLACS